MGNNNRPAEDIVKFVLRIPPKLHKRIKRSAKANNTSMNKQIINEMEAKQVDRKRLDHLIKLLEK